MIPNWGEIFDKGGGVNCYLFCFPVMARCSSGRNLPRRSHPVSAEGVKMRNAFIYYF